MGVAGDCRKPRGIARAEAATAQRRRAVPSMTAMAARGTRLHRSRCELSSRSESAEGGNARTTQGACQGRSAQTTPIAVLAPPGNGTTLPPAGYGGAIQTNVLTARPAQPLDGCRREQGGMRMVGGWSLVCREGFESASGENLTIK